MQLRARLLRLADRFVPPSNDYETIQGQRAAVLQSWLGVFFTLTFGALYAFMGSPWSGAGILLIALGLLLTPSAISRGYSRVQIGNTLIAMTWLMTFVVASRSGGFSSPSLVWSFLLPLCTYAACNERSAIVWAVLGALQVSGYYLAELLGVRFAQDFGPGLLAVLRISGYLGVILAVVTVILVVESARLAAVDALAKSQRALERERMVSDMHDGLGSQLLSLTLQARAGSVESSQLVRELETCMDDLRLIVGSRDAEESSLEQNLGELRARMTPRCEAAGIELVWGVNVNPGPLGPEVTLQVLRSVQELLSNAIRHARPARVELVLIEHPTRPSWLLLELIDDGVGLAWAGEAGPRRGAGRGLGNLRTRAHRLGGRFELVSPEAGGTRATLEFPRELPAQSGHTR